MKSRRRASHSFGILDGGSTRPRAYCRIRLQKDTGGFFVVLRSPENRETLAQRFGEQGFLTLPDVLRTDQVATLNEAIDQLLDQHPQDWWELSDSFRQAANVLPRTAAFDFTIEHPGVLSLMRQLIGDDLTFEEFSILIRDPATNLEEAKGWHRDITRDYRRRREIDTISVVYLLTDVTEQDHCFSIVPESHNRLVDLRPGEHHPGDEVDILGPAGTAIVFHARCLHRGKLKPRSRQRRSLHVYYSRASGPRTSEWSEIPRRLHEKADLGLAPLLYSKWNRTDVFDGTGKKPDDLDPALSMAEMLREVQRRAKREAART